MLVDITFQRRSFHKLKIRIVVWWRESASSPHVHHSRKMLFKRFICMRQGTTLPKSTRNGIHSLLFGYLYECSWITMGNEKTSFSHLIYLTDDGVINVLQIIFQILYVRFAKSITNITAIVTQGEMKIICAAVSASRQPSRNVR